MVRGRTTAPVGMVLGHEITGEIVEIGKDVEYLKVGEIVSVPFNVACGRCRTCREGDTGVCLNVNGERAGGAYGYVDMAGWIGGQAKFVMVPYADFNLLKFPDKESRCRLQHRGWPDVRAGVAIAQERRATSGYLKQGRAARQFMR
jgi:glutathione-independent formaldehyde dehydrogenase